MPDSANTLDLSAALDLPGGLRRVAVQAVQWQYEAILKSLVQQFEFVDDQDEDPIGPVLSRPGHRGEPTRDIDFKAHSALKEFLRRRWVLPHNYYIIGEEANEPINLRDQNAVLVRSDPLDGTTNCVTLLGSWATVVCFDVARKNRPGRFRHVAGAIATSAGWLLSWSVWSDYRPDGTRNSFGKTTVFLQSIPIHFFSSGEPARRWQLSSLTKGNPRRLAAVCASASRRAEVLQRFQADMDDTWLWSGAGNPLGPALLAGELGGILEPSAVTLHDSAFLIPFELLGGTTVTLDGSPFSALDAYEAAATRPDDQPIPPFLAYKEPRLAGRLGLLR
ncbi:hypothetical protein BBK82_46760 [Lentzea guizhouensis]|uniref:Inositol monophosphatase n=1 Tax=Lentzea guizhouensis TaxID=1586287 RepID=A0A1B2HX90_9PSEU|nr:inositol monophosphatase family protein [Lentzea guizhouensis]ANZ42314.1 hypothetical protein BBK82_46760 [Lentzea guizhouensis]